MVLSISSFYQIGFNLIDETFKDTGIFQAENPLIKDLLEREDGWVPRMDPLFDIRFQVLQDAGELYIFTWSRYLVVQE